MDDIRSRLRGAGQRSYPPSRPTSARPTTVTRPPAPTRRSQAPQPKPVPPQSPKPPAPPAKRPPTPRGKRRRWPIVVVILLLVIGSGAFMYFKKAGNDGGQSPYALDGRSRTIEVSPEAQSSEQQPQQAETLRLVATGDMIAHDSINENAKKADGSYDYAALMADMKPFFEKADVSFCNQSTPAGGAQFGISGYPVFNAPVEFARGIEDVGCNVINIGTNHTNDKGQPLIDATVAAWDNRPDVLAVAGANRSAEEQNKVRYFESKGMKFAFLSYTTYTNKPTTTPYGINMYSDALATAQITEARKEADFVLVSMRWGTEYSPDVNAQQDQIAQKLSDLGADVVLGHGPHVLEPVKKLKSADGSRETIVWYSLGNFLNSQLDIESLIGGFAVMDIDTSTKKITDISFMPVYQHYEWTPEQKNRANGADLLQRHSFTMVPLDKAADLLAKSQNNTTVQAQTERVKSVLNKFTEVEVITSDKY